MADPETQIVNSIGTTLMLIPAGEFEMGSPPKAKMASMDEQPQHKVVISRPFYLGTKWGQ